MKTLEYQVIRHKLSKYITIEKKEKLVQCDLGEGSNTKGK